MGSHASKVVGPTLTPFIAGTFGWRTVRAPSTRPRLHAGRGLFCGCTSAGKVVLRRARAVVQVTKIYAIAFAVYAAAWQFGMRKQPRPPPPPLPLQDSGKDEAVAGAAGAAAAEGSAEVTGTHQGGVAKKFELALLFSPPQQACAWIQVRPTQHKTPTHESTLTSRRPAGHPRPNRVPDPRFLGSDILPRGARGPAGHRWRLHISADGDLDGCALRTAGQPASLACPHTETHPARLLCPPQQMVGLCCGPCPGPSPTMHLALRPCLALTRTAR